MAKARFQVCLPSYFQYLGQSLPSGANDELLHQFNALKETYAQEMEKKVIFSNLGSRGMASNF